MISAKGVLAHIIGATGYSLAGLRQAYARETAFRIEVGLGSILLPLGLWLGNSGVERVLLVGSLLLVLMMELVNSGIEAVVDRIGPEHHPLSGRAKDVGSAAVMLALFNVLLVWGLIIADALSRQP